MSTERQRRPPTEYTERWPYGDFEKGDRSVPGDYIARRAARQVAQVVLAVQHARHARGWTQQDLAEQADTSQKTISEFESGKVWPDLFSVAKACEALDLDLRAAARHVEDGPT